MEAAGYFNFVWLSFKVTLTQDLGSVRRWDPFKESSDRLLPHRAWMQSCMRSSPQRRLWKSLRILNETTLSQLCCHEVLQITRLLHTHVALMEVTIMEEVC